MGRYSIEVGDDYVEIDGDLSIEEAFDFMNFFERKGYHSLTSGHESTIYMCRTSIEDKKENFQTKQHIEKENFYEALYKDCKLTIEKLENEKITLENFFREIKSDSFKRQTQLQRDNEELRKTIGRLTFGQNAEAQKIIESFLHDPGSSNVTPD